VVVDLSGMSSLPVKLRTRDLLLSMGRSMECRPAVHRTRAEMQEVLLEPRAKGPERHYTMYHDVHLKKDAGVLQEAGFRYDMTVIRPAIIGREFNKTMGHYHPALPGLGLSYPEVYEVISGGALCLLQKTRTLADPRRVTDVVTIEARPGDRTIIPPNYGHVTINPYKTPLVMADATATGFVSTYDPYRRLRGAAYHLVLEKGRPTWVPNPLYLSHPAIRELAPRDPSALGMRRNVPLYRSLLEKPESFEFLRKPQYHLDLLNSVLS
jgi:glucose-6-phosphate isomerase